MWHARATLILPAVGLLLALGQRPAQAQRLPLRQYAVKVLCGKPDSRVLAPGIYFTAINVHNPNRDSLVFRFKVAVASSDTTRGVISKLVPVVIRRDEAIEIDCPRLMAMVRSRRFLKGFAVLITNQPLDVVGVYTAAGRDAMVSTLAVERVPADTVTGGY